MKKIERDITSRFSGINEWIVSDIVEYYNENLGGENGCEECGDYLCYECEQDLANYAEKLIKHNK